MKITKSELKNLIRECLREELSNRSTLIEAADNNYFFMVLLRDVNAYRIEEITTDEAEARNAYDRAIAKYKAALTDEAIMLVKVFDMSAYDTLRPFALRGFIKDRTINRLLASILESSSDALEYYEAGDEDEDTGNYRVVLADYDTDDFDINVEFGIQDPDENEIVNYEYLLEPGQTKGDLIVYLSRDCGFTSIYVHDERPASASDIKRLSSDTFPVTGTDEYDWQNYGSMD